MVTKLNLYSCRVKYFTFNRQQFRLYDIPEFQTGISQPIIKITPKQKVLSQKGKLVLDFFSFF